VLCPLPLVEYFLGPEEPIGIRLAVKSSTRISICIASDEAIKCDRKLLTPIPCSSY
jgi:hypothetical protein